MQLHIRLIFDTNRGDWISQRFLVVVKGHFVKLGTSIFAIESSFWRPGTALSLAFTSNLLVFGSFLVAETTRDLGLLLVSVFHRNRVD